MGILELYYDISKIYNINNEKQISIYKKCKNQYPHAGESLCYNYSKKCKNQYV